MSGIIGSKLNIRGSGLVGSLGTDGQHLLSSGAGKTNAFEAAAAAGLTAAEGTAIRQDVVTLALKQAVTENQAAFNLPNSFIDQFESDSGIGTETDGDRSDSEYWSTIGFDRAYTVTAGTHASNLTLGSGSWTGALTNDYTNGSGVGMYPDVLYDLAADWKIRVFNNDSSGDTRNTNGGYGMYSAVVTTDTSVAAGANPTVLRDQDNTNGSYGNFSPTNLRDWWLTDAYGGTLNTDAMTDNYVLGATNQTIDLSSASGMARGYNNSNSNKNYGSQVTYDRTANTITIQPSNSVDFSTMYTTTNCTFTNVPATGRFMAYFGYANGSTDYVSTTRNTAGAYANTDFGYLQTVSANATGTLIGNANIPSAAQTKVSGVMLYKDNAGTASIGTDLKIYFTCDNSNWTEVPTYTAVTPLFSTGIKMVKLAQTTCTSGSDVRYKAVFANQSSGSKETQLHGIGINY